MDEVSRCLSGNWTARGREGETHKYFLLGSASMLVLLARAKKGEERGMIREEARRREDIEMWGEQPRSARARFKRGRGTLAFDSCPKRPPDLQAQLDSSSQYKWRTRTARQRSPSRTAYERSSRLEEQHHSAQRRRLHLVNQHRERLSGTMGRTRRIAQEGGGTQGWCWASAGTAWVHRRLPPAPAPAPTKPRTLLKAASRTSSQSTATPSPLRPPPNLPPPFETSPSTLPSSLPSPSGLAQHLPPSRVRAPLLQAPSAWNPFLHSSDRVQGAVPRCCLLRAGAGASCQPARSLGVWEVREGGWEGQVPPLQTRCDRWDGRGRLCRTSGSAPRPPRRTTRSCRSIRLRWATTSQGEATRRHRNGCFSLLHPTSAAQTRSSRPPSSLHDSLLAEPKLSTYLPPPPPPRPLHHLFLLGPAFIPDPRILRTRTPRTLHAPLPQYPRDPAPSLPPAHPTARALTQPLLPTHTLITSLHPRRLPPRPSPRPPPAIRDTPKRKRGSNPSPSPPTALPPSSNPSTPHSLLPPLYQHARPSLLLQPPHVAPSPLPPSPPPPSPLPTSPLSSPSTLSLSRPLEHPRDVRSTLARKRGTALISRGWSRGWGGRPSLLGSREGSWKEWS